MSELRDQAIRLLLVEDVEADAERAVYQFRRAGIGCDARRVETSPELVAALEDFAPTIILSDFTLPQFDGMAALQICREQAPEVPFLFVSGTIGEERAVAALHAGAADYVLKENLIRLVPAAQRAISDARARAERLQQEAQIARMNRVLRMLGGVNELVFRLRDRTELLAETCRLAISLGGYAMAVAATATRGGASIKAVASNGLDEETTARLSAYVEESAARESSVIGRVFRTGKEFVCNDTVDIGATARFDSLMLHAGLRSVVVLPLQVDSETSAVLLLTARDSGKLSAEELGMLRDLARSLSFGLQYVNRDTRVRFLSYFDSQTGLARRSLFSERVRDQIAAASAFRHVVVIMDIRRLSTINDSFGRNAGDLLLRLVAERLKQHYPSRSTWPTSAAAHSRWCGVGSRRRRWRICRRTVRNWRRSCLASPSGSRGTGFPWRPDSPMRCTPTTAPMPRPWCRMSKERCCSRVPAGAPRCASIPPQGCRASGN